MEVEVKLRLPDSDSHQRLSDLLSPFHRKTLIQDNFFFDDADSNLSSNLAVLRLRFYDLDARCVLSLKAKPVISRGISRVEELEEPVCPQNARACLADPRLLWVSFGETKIMKRVSEEFGVRAGTGFQYLGRFGNVRGVYRWRELTLELDETIYEFGTSYEIECETRDPERDGALIEDFLRENGIDFQYSDMNKFAVLRAGKLPK
ncbi:triphosphate tunel metalloenzyme 3-like [Carica papaya]|uniref:triphosphate tunel metalloenzyme 3-like n=1 Tax=Carica papaya TaxID=3649 RepID=UPI000B8CB3F6|nr:triphosphate tunel metalloenzyme 3-like [Carica papaya]